MARCQRLRDETVDLFGRQRIEGGSDVARVAGDEARQIVRQRSRVQPLERSAVLDLATPFEAELVEAGKAEASKEAHCRCAGDPCALGQLVGAIEGDRVQMTQDHVGQAPLGGRQLVVDFENPAPDRHSGPHEI